MLRAIKIRLYPNKEQVGQFNRLLGCCRFVYNQCLARKIKSYDERKFSENQTTLGCFIHHELLADERFVWLRNQNTKVLKQTVIDLMAAYKNFFEGNAEFPKFKKKHVKTSSCRFEIGAISKRNDYTTYHLSLANIKNVKFRCSKKYADYLQKHKNHIKSATLKRLPCGIFQLSVLVDGDLMHQVNETNSVVGIDLGVKDFVVTSEGEVFENLHFKKNESRKLKKLDRQLSRKKEGSNNWNKARLRLAREYYKIGNKKRHYLHAVSNSLIDENQVICMENLNVSGMMQNHNLAESISEMNFGEFRRMLEYKAEWYNRKMVFVGRFYPSSKTCNHCGYINKELKLSDRRWTCPHCGHVIERDYNAALNILDEGMKIIGRSTPESKLVENPTVDEPTGDSSLKSSGSVKQEANKAQCLTLCKF